MSARETSVVRISSNHSNAALSKTQKQFNTLVKKVERLKQELLEWRDGVPNLFRRLSSEYNPLRQRLQALRLQLVQMFDHAHGHKGVARHEQKKLQHLIQQLTVTLLAEAPSAEAKALHDKYSDISYDEQQEAVGDLMKSMVEEAFGFEVGDDVDLSSRAKLDEFMAQKVREHEEQSAHIETSDNRAERKRSAKQIAKEQQEKAEELDVYKSLQEVYRKLAAALHPDRERDAVERERKTELMQRVNVAYGKKDLLQLLELHLTVEQVDTLHSNAMSEQRLKHFNKILRQQCNELQQAIGEAQLPFRAQFEASPFVALTAKQITTRMELDLKHLRQDVATLQHDVRDLSNVAVLKAWLREYRIPKQSSYDDPADWMLDEALRRTR